MSVIEIKNLTKYYGRSRGIENINLRVEKGEIFGFIGPNGAGKSTTIRTLMGLIFPTSGGADIFGMDVCRQGRGIRKRVGYLPGEVDYYDRMSVRELMEYSARFYGVTLGRRFGDLAETFAVELKRNINDLSAGNKRKVSILQCLLHSPELLILDEPTNGLDPLMQARFYDVIRRENEGGVTVFFSSHILGEVQRICRRVAIIKGGAIIAQEDIDALRKKHLNRVCVDFEGAVPEEELWIDGVVSVDRRNAGFRMLYSGEINPLVAMLSRRNIRSLTIEEPTLEEVFMHYYESDEPAMRRGRIEAASAGRSDS